MTRVTDQDLQQWETLSARATHGPWEPCAAQPDAACSCGLVWSIPADAPVAAWHSEDGHSGRAQDVLFIAAARTAVPALIDEVKRLRKLDPDAERDRLVLFKEATDAAIAELSPKMDAVYGDIIDRLAGEKEQLRAEVERMRPVYAATKAWRELMPVDAATASNTMSGDSPYLPEIVAQIVAVDAALATERDGEGQL